MACICAKCGHEVSNDEIGMTKKMINRGTSTYLCFDCLSDYFEIPKENLLAKLEQFRADGCTLFAKKD